MEAIKQSFAQFVRLVPKDGLIIANFDDENVIEVVKDACCSVQSYGSSPGCHWRLEPPSYVDGFTKAPLYLDDTFFVDLKIRNPGLHNCMNGTAAAAVMHHLGFERDRIRDALSCFSGVRRRQEVKGIENGITVIDDFAHHPTAVRETLKALKQAYPGSRLIAVFEPRTNTSRRSLFQNDYVTSFLDADMSLIKKPQPREGDSSDMLSPEKLADDLGEREKEAKSFNDTDAILAYLKTICRPGDVIAILSNGGFDNIHERLLTDLRGV